MSDNPKVKAFHMALGVDLIGSATSMHSSANVSLEATSVGIRMYSKRSNRTIVIPYSNVKGFELFTDTPKAEPKAELKKPNAKS